MQALLMFCTLLAPPWTWRTHSELWHLEPDLPAVGERTEESHRTSKQRLLKLVCAFSVLMRRRTGNSSSGRFHCPRNCQADGNEVMGKQGAVLLYLICGISRTSTFLSSSWHPTFQLPQCSAAPSPEGFLVERSFLFSFFMNRLHKCSPRDGGTGPQAERREGRSETALCSPSFPTSQIMFRQAC